MFLKLYQILHSHNLRQSVCVCVGVWVNLCRFMNFTFFCVVLHVHLVVLVLRYVLFIYYRFFLFVFCSKSSKEIINFSL